MPSLRSWPAFAHLRDDQAALLEACTIRHPFPAGTSVVREREPNREAYLVEEGLISLHRNTPFGHFVLAELGPGALFGEMSYVDSELRSVDAHAVRDSVLLVFDPRRMELASAEDPVLEVALYWALWRSLSEKLRGTNDRLAHFFVDQPPPLRRQSAPPPGAVRLDLDARRAVFRELGLSNMEANLLSSLCEPQRLDAHQPLFYEGEPGDEAFVVVEGRIMISKNIPEAGEEALAFVGRPELFGEMSVIDRMPRSADARADADGATLLAIRREVLDKLLDIEKASSIRLLKLLCRLMARRLRDANEKILGWYLLSGGAAPQFLRDDD